MFYNLYITDWGEVRVSQAEGAALKYAEDVRQHPHLRGSVLEKKALGMEGAIIAACNRFAKHKYDNGRA